jgi:hypothetical protein
MRGQAEDLDALQNRSVERHTPSDGRQGRLTSMDGFLP